MVLLVNSGYDIYWAKHGEMAVITDCSVQAEGKVQDGIDCHGLRKDNDYTYSGSLK